MAFGRLAFELSYKYFFRIPDNDNDYWICAHFSNIFHNEQIYYAKCRLINRINMVRDKTGNWGYHQEYYNDGGLMARTGTDFIKIWRRFLGNQKG